jgi:hypothetical protein
VVEDGDTDAEPEVVPPVEKLTPELLLDAAQDHERVVLSPELIVVGLPASVGGVGITVTVALALAVPPTPVQFTV